MTPIDRSPKQRKKSQYKFRRGSYCGLISTRFMAEMVGLSYWETHRLLKAWLNENDKIPREMQPNDIYKFVIFVYKCRGISDSPLDHVEL